MSAVDAGSVRVHVLVDEHGVQRRSLDRAIIDELAEQLAATQALAASRAEDLETMRELCAQLIARAGKLSARLERLQAQHSALLEHMRTERPTT